MSTINTLAEHRVMLKTLKRIATSQCDGKPSRSAVEAQKALSQINRMRKHARDFETTKPPAVERQTSFIVLP